jgi:hypothetical protein
MKSHEFLQAAINVQSERGKQYDKPTGERSMGATISAFNCITGRTLEESDGWLILSLLKLVRQAQNPEQYHHDSALDFVAYASLYAEAASEQCGQLEAQQAEASSHIFSDNTDWSIAPEYAKWLAQDHDGTWHWFDSKPFTLEFAWDFASTSYDVALKTGVISSNWKNTLQSRPTSTAQ